VEIDPLIFAGICDCAGLVRGKAFPTADIGTRMHKGVGLTHFNIMMSCFGPIYTTPFGTGSDLIIRPDLSMRVDVPFDDGTAQRFYLGDVANTGGPPWECCPRSFLIRALAALGECHLDLVASLEQEFMLAGVEDRAGARYTLDAYRRQRSFGEALMAAIRVAGFRPDSFLPEYGLRQYEMTLAPERGVRAADAAVVAHLPAIAAFSAPSAASYRRLTPNRWAPVHADIGVQDRGTAMRVSPLFETSPEDPTSQLNVEFRVADASNCSYLALGAIVWGDVDGLRRNLALPAEGVEAPSLPRSLEAALDALEADEAARSWWSETAMSTYLAFKRAELTALEGLDAHEICRRYAEVY